MTYDYFRSIAITPIPCKVFEYCLLEKIQSVLASGINQFGFKKEWVVLRPFMLVAIYLIILCNQVTLQTYVHLTYKGI